MTYICKVSSQLIEHVILSITVSILIHFHRAKLDKLWPATCNCMWDMENDRKSHVAYQMASFRFRFY